MTIAEVRALSATLQELESDEPELYKIIICTQTLNEKGES